MPNLSIRWRSRPAPLEHEIDALKTVVIQLRRELENKQGYAGRLEMLLRSRTERIDQLNGQLEQVRRRTGAWMKRQSA